MNSVLDRMTPFEAMDVLERSRKLERKGEDVVHLEAGEPDFDVHPLVVKAAKAAFDEHRTHYTDGFGDLELREEICRLYRVEHGVEVSPDRVLVSCGSSAALMLALQAICDVDDEVLVANPGYPCYRDFVLAAHAKSVEYPVDSANGFQPVPADIVPLITPRTRAIFVNSPSNPAGTLAAPDVLKALVELFPGDSKHAPVVLSDEIYDGLVYGGAKARSILEFTDNAFVFNGFSKRFAMTGLRLGYMIMPKRFVRPLRILQQNLFICAGSVAQRAGLEALRLLLGDDADAAAFRRDQAAMLAEYDARRRFMLSRIRDIGMEVAAEPHGAFYVFADARRYAADSSVFAASVLERAHVGITPGVDFGSRGQGFLRFSYATSIPRIREAFNRMAEF